MVPNEAVPKVGLTFRITSFVSVPVPADVMLSKKSTLRDTFTSC